MDTIFYDKDGSPIYVLGLQAYNSSDGCWEMIDKSISAVKQYHGNTIEVPVYWYQIEPEEGCFDMSMVELLIRKVRECELNLIILWFGFSKNADLTYMPEWAKRNPDRFRLAVGMDGSVVPMMSPHCEETIEADKKAFVELVAFIRKVDERERTVIALQVENEIGLYPIDRCYSHKAQEDFEKGVPSELDGVSLKKENQLEKGGSWYERFGSHAHEAFSAWYFGVAVEKIASAGKRVYPGLPFYMNTMLGEIRQEIAGHSYSSGSPVGRVLDIWKKAAPSISFFAPDIYVRNLNAYKRACMVYGRQDNPLFIPETGTMGEAFSINLIHAAGEFGAIGICGFGAEGTVEVDGKLKEESKKVAVTMEIIKSMSPLLLKYRNTGKIFCVSQEEFQDYTYVERNQYHITFHYGNTNTKGNPLWRNLRTDNILKENPNVFLERGRGIICEVKPDEYYMAGVGFSARFLLKSQPDDRYPGRIYASRAATELSAITIEEGHFTKDGDWVCEFVRRGDEIDYGAFVYPGVVVKVKLNPDACKTIEW